MKAEIQNKYFSAPSNIRWTLFPQTGHTDLLLALFMEQFSQVVQATGDGVLVSVRILQILIGNVSTSKEGAFGLFQVALVHQNYSYIQVGRCEFRVKKKQVQLKACEMI